MFSNKSETRSPQGHPKTVASNGSTFSVIGSDVVIKGDVVASADLHVDGRIDGDIECTSLVQGEGSTIKGAITTETARLAGTVVGSISARHLVVLKSARIEGDVTYDALTIEQGAAVEGRFAPGAAAPAAKPAPTAATSAPEANDGDEPRLTLAR